MSASASASGFAGDDGTPRNGGRGGRGGPADADRGGPPAGGGSAGPDDHHADDLSQEEILDLIVEAMLAAGGPGAEDDDPGGDDDGANAGSPPAASPVAAWTCGTRRARGRRAQDADGRDCGPAGFGSGQPLDVLRPGPVLAGEADRAHTGALRAVSDEELTGMIRAWRRLSSWATARELGAVAEFARRRPAEDTELTLPGMPGPAGPPAARRRRPRRPAPLDSPDRRGTSAAQAAQPMQRPGHTQRPGPQLLRLAGLTGQARRSGRRGCACWRANPSAQAAPAAAAASAGGANPAGRAEACGGGGPPRDRVFPR